MFTKTATREYTDARFQRGDVLVFGSESNGLPPSLLEANRDRAATNSDSASGAQPESVEQRGDRAVRSAAAVELMRYDFCSISLLATFT